MYGFDEDTLRDEAEIGLNNLSLTDKVFSFATDNFYMSISEETSGNNTFIDYDISFQGYRLIIYTNDSLEIDDKYFSLIDLDTCLFLSDEFFYYTNDSFRLSINNIISFSTTFLEEFNLLGEIHSARTTGTLKICHTLLNGKETFFLASNTFNSNSMYFEDTD